MYGHYFSNSGKPPIILATLVDLQSRLFMLRFSHKASSVLEKKILKVFTIYGHGGHFGQWTATILAIFHSAAPGRLQMKFEQHWPRGSRGEVTGNSQHFFPYKSIGKQT